jgi:RimJ/RimL family protein N-acetyltransferase
MKWHRRRIPKLMETITTERFSLKPVGRFRSVLLHMRMNDDPEILAQITHRAKGLSFLQWCRRADATNGRSRFTHEIITRDEGKTIGFHTLRLRPYKSAAIAVFILDRDWWGKNVPLEARQAILAHFVCHAGVERIAGLVEARNFASIANYRKLGFKHVGTQHRMAYDEMRQAPVDYLEFELLKEDFPPYLSGHLS